MAVEKGSHDERECFNQILARRYVTLWYDAGGSKII